MENKTINYINGQYVAEDESKIGITDIAFIRGFGVFDFVRTYKKKPFLFLEHIKRLFSSAEQVNIKHTLDFDQILNIVNKLIEINNFDEYTFRIILTAGFSPDGMKVDDKQFNLYIITRNLVSPASELYTNGVKLVSDNYLRDFPTVKSLNYLNLMSKRELISKSGAFTLLYTHNNKILEAAISNVFIIKNNTVITPKNNVLIGTTRNLTINLIQSLYKVEERDIDVTELIDADEVFITGTTQGVLPVVKVDEREYSNGKPGEITKNIINIFNQYVNDQSK